MSQSADRHSVFRSTRRIRMSAACVTLGVVLAGCSDDSGTGQDEGSGSQVQPKAEDGSATAQLNQVTDYASVAGGGDEATGSLSVDVSNALFASAPAVVVASVGDEAGIQQAAEGAQTLGVPMLLVGESAPTTDDLATSTTDTSATTATSDESSSTAPTSGNGASAALAEIERLGAQQVVAIGEATESALGTIDDVDVVSDVDDVDDVSPAEGLTTLAVLVDSGGGDPSAAASASATAAGASVIGVKDGDVQNDGDAITALSEAKPESVLAVGPAFGDAETLTRHVEVAATGVQLPGGGQALFPNHLMVALYGTPGTPGLGVLGEQDLDASIARAKEVAADFEPLTDVPVVPTFEIIATIAQGSAGPDGDYSGEIGVEDLRPWIEKAGEEGVYVVLDLQPGRANFLDQAKLYEDLLKYPHVGLALDPEWRLTATQKPLQQIGQVEADEVNTVLEWLADLTKEEKLPQKLVVLHQFRLSMLQDQDQIDMDRDELQLLIHMDGQGSPDLKDGTWQSVVGNAAEGMPFGWKNFYDEDAPMLTPEQTMNKEPTPDMVSYQ